MEKSDPRPGLACVTAALVGFGIIMIFSVSSAANPGAIQFGLAVKQAVSVVVGISALLAVRRIGYHRLVRWRWILFGLAVVSLIIVLTPQLGARVNGARRWFRLGPIGVQPSEFAKIALIVFLAGFLAKKRERASALVGGFLPGACAILAVCALMQAEPDFGSAVLTALVGFSLLFVAGIKFLHIAVITGMAVPTLWAAIVYAPYRMQRLTTFLDPWADPRGTGYHIIQSLIAVGSGGFFGVGLGRSTQKLHYLPAAYSDFVFAIIGEETGHLGCLMITGLLLAFLWYAVRICREARDDAGFFLAFGLITSIMLQATINIAVVTACIPAKGLPLPFVSFGGSNLVASLIAVGILLNIADHSCAEHLPAAEPLRATEDSNWHRFPLIESFKRN